MAFYVRLRKFFQQNDPHRLYLVKKIVVSFRDDEDLIMDRLEQIYKDGGPSKLVSSGGSTKKHSYNDSFSSTNLDESTNENVESNLSNSSDESSTNDSNPPKAKKSKKKLIILIVLALILSAGCYFGYEFFIKEKQSSEKTDDSNNSENEATDEKSETEPIVEEPAPVIADTVKDSISSTLDTLAINSDLDSTVSANSSDEEDND